MNAFDRKVFALCKSNLTNIVRPIRFNAKQDAEEFGHHYQIGNVQYVLGPGEHIPILFMGAVQLNDWIICLEKSLLDANGRPMICGFYKGQQHVNFGPVESDDLLTEFFSFFNEKILK